MSTKLDTRQSANRSALNMVGSASNEDLDSILSKIDAELAKLFEDRNMTLVDGGLISLNALGTSVTFSTNLRLQINSRVAGGAPVSIDLAATTRAFSANSRMLYATIDRIAGTATVVADSATLPAVTSANQEVVLIAKRSDSGDGIPRVYFRSGFSLSAGQSARLGSAGSIYSSEFRIKDQTDTTKQWLSQVSGATTGTSTTLAFAQTANRVLTFPDVTDTIAALAATQSLSNKQISYSVSNDAATTGSNATLAAFTTGVVRLTNVSLTSVSGIPAGGSGQSLVIENQTGNFITVNNNDTGATAANRIFTGIGAPVSMPPNASFIFTYDTTASRWMLTGGSGSGSGSGSKNYLSTIIASTGSGVPNSGNGNFEFGSTTGFSLFNTTLTGVIPTGSITAGAASITTFGVVSSGQLAGAYSMQTASSGVWTAGQGVISDAFFIDEEDKSKVLSFKAYYKVQANPANGNFSGTSSNTFATYIYDVTNSVWIQPSGVYGITQSSGAGYVQGTFQTSANSTQYRLAILAVNASSGAITMYWDDLFVGPQQVVNGVFPQASTRTVLTGAGTYTVPSNVYMIRVRAVGAGGGGAASSSANSQTAATAGAATTFGSVITANGGGLGTFVGTGGPQAGGAGGTATSTITGAYTATGGDGTGGSSTSTGEVIAGGAGGNSYFGGGGGGGGGGSGAGTGTVGTAGKAGTGGGGGGASGSANAGTSSGPAGGAGGFVDVFIKDLDLLALVMTPPSYSVGAGGSGGVHTGGNGTNGGAGGSGTIIIDEYYRGTNFSMSSDSDTRVVAASAYASTNQSGSTASPWNFDTVVFDSHGAITTGASWSFTAPISGYYEVSFNAAANATSGVNIYVNGVATASLGFFDVGTSFGGGSQGVAVNAGDTIDIRPTVAATQIIGSATLPNGTTGRGTITISRLAGPSQVAASESVNMSANSSTTSVPGTSTDTALVYLFKDYDSHNAYNVSTGVYTVPISGKYRVTGSVQYGSRNIGVGGTQRLLVYKNGSNYRTLVRMNLANINTAIQQLSGSYTLDCLAGDTLQIYANDNSPGTGDGTNNSFFMVEKVGN